MELKPVKSSNIRKIGYDPAEKKLVVLFRNGNKYAYFPIEPKVHQELISAESIGKYFYENIRNNKDINYEPAD